MLKHPDLDRWVSPDRTWESKKLAHGDFISMAWLKAEHRLARSSAPSNEKGMRPTPTVMLEREGHDQFSVPRRAELDSGGSSSATLLGPVVHRCGSYRGCKQPKEHNAITDKENQHDFT
jgi:hypothetical protein